MLQMRTLTALLFLGAAGYADLKARKVPLALLVPGALFALILRIPSGLASEALIADLAPGLFLLFCSLVRKEAIGSGDGAAVMVLGLCMGGMDALAAAGAGMVLLGGTGLFLGLSGRKVQTLPFLPFLFTADLFLLLTRALSAPGGTL